MKLTEGIAQIVASRMTSDGFYCTPSDVWNVYRNGTILSNEALASRILQEFEELGVKV